MTVSSSHRFLSGRNPQNRVWVLHGNIQDIYLHNTYHGCLSLDETLARWARGHDMPYCVVLRRSGELDFSLNADPEAAERAFDGTREPVRRRSNQFVPDEAEESEPESNEDTRAGRATAHVTAAAGGDSRAVVNNLTRLAIALRAELGLLAIIEDFEGFIEAFRVKEPGIAMDIDHILTREIHGHVNPRSLLVLPSFDERALREILPSSQYPDVEWIQPGPPKPDEIAEVVDRLSERHGFTVGGRKAIAQALSKFEFLKASCNRMALAARTLPPDGGTLTLASILNLPAVNEDRVESILADLDRLVGLHEVKDKARELVEVARQRRVRLMQPDAELPDDCLHLVFTGRPGTGKTTVARIIARLFHALGLLERDSVKEVTASTLMHSNVGETREKMQEVIEDARGGVLFIDEAPQFGDPENPQAKEAIQALLPWSWNYRTEMVIILAGYADRMPEFFRMDEGLDRRFPPTNRMEFADYTVDELWQILGMALAKEGLQAPGSLETRLRNLLRRRASRTSFGNAGGAENLAKEIRGRRDQRRAGGGELEEADLPPLVRRHNREYDEAMAELSRLQGLGPVKEQVERLMNELEIDLANFEAGLTREVRTHPGNFLFFGPPGTGKTTVARIMGKLLYGLGCIERSHTGEHRRADLVAGYLGQTAILTKKAVEQDRDGVFFLDEAYALSRDSHDSFGQEAIDTLVGEITSRDSQGTVFIFAGYEDELESFMRSNPGLQSRFSQRIEFPNFEPRDCADLARHAFERSGYACDADVLDRVREVAAAAREREGRNFGNARWVLGLAAETMSNQKQRVKRDGIPVGDRERRMTVSVGDLPGLATMPASPDRGGRDGQMSRAERMRGSWTPRAEALALLTRSDELTRDDDDLVRMLNENAFQIVASGRRDGADLSWTGTGFLVTPDGLVATAAHLVEGARELHVFCGPGSRRTAVPARVLAVEGRVDLAIISVETPPGVPGLPLGMSRMVSQLTPLVVLGNAHVQPGQPSQLVMARVSRNTQDDDIYIESDGAIEQGFSGGPVVDIRQGAVVGVVSGGRGPSATYHIRSENLRGMLEEYGYSFEESRTTGQQRPAGPPPAASGGID